MAGRRLLVVAVGALLLLVAALVDPSVAAPPVAADVPALFHPDPEHLWNRLHAALFVRVGQDGASYGQDRLEPLLWADSQYLLEDRSNSHAAALLAEFLDTDGEKLIDDPLKRAILQRDLWLVFNWADVARNKLHTPLAKAIGRLALSTEAIRKLPDNYAAATTSGEFASRFDPAAADKPYLPPDLFAPEGPWVCVGRTDGVTAPQHLRPENPFVNSVFLVLLRLPEGKAATEDYLKRLFSFDQPVVVGKSIGGWLEFSANTDLPQFPKGTEVALVRQAQLVDLSHQIVASPLTESVQVRIAFEDPPLLSPQVLEDGFGNSRSARERIGKWQAFGEFRLTRAKLFAGAAGGLRAIAPDDRDFRTGFMAHVFDPFESNAAGPGRPFVQRLERDLIQESCFGCHGLPGVYSFNSHYDFRGGLNGSDKEVRANPLAIRTVAEVREAGIKRSEGRESWIALRKLLAE